MASSKDKELGYLMMKTFSQYFKENEKKWAHIVNGLKDYIDKLKRERESLLCKFKPEKDDTVIVNMRQILKDHDLSTENLVQHNVIIE